MSRNGGPEFHTGYVRDSPNTPEPPPKPSPETPAWDLVLADIAERDKMGTEKYGQRLTPGDGRDSLVDAYQEALDLVVYLRKAIAERSSAVSARKTEEKKARLCSLAATRARDALFEMQWPAGYEAEAEEIICDLDHLRASMFRMAALLEANQDPQQLKTSPGEK